MHWRIPCLFLLATLSSGVHARDQEEWVQIFNGRNLDGWIPKIRGHEAGVNFGNTFRVANGVMQVGYEAYEGPFNARFGHIFYKRPYAYYILVVEYRFVGEQAEDGPEWALRNSGIMLHSPAPETMRRDQDFPISIEVQLLGGDGERERTTMNLCTPGTNVVIDGKLDTRHCIKSRSKTYHGEQWVRAEVMVLGSSVIRHIAEGEVVLEYEMPQIGGGNVDGPRSGGQAGRRVARERLHLPAEREPPHRVPQGRASEPGRMHGSGRVELQALLRQVRAGHLPLLTPRSSARRWIILDSCRF